MKTHLISITCLFLVTFSSYTRENLKIKDVLLVKEITFRPDTNLHLKDARAEGDTLVLDIRYTGGKAHHAFNLYFDGKYKKSMPPKATLYLKHGHDKETCDKIITETLYFNLKPVRYDNSKKIQLFLSGYDISVWYNY